MVEGVPFDDGGGVFSDLVRTRVEGCIVDILGDGFIAGVWSHPCIWLRSWEHVFGRFL